MSDCFISGGWQPQRLKESSIGIYYSLFVHIRGKAQSEGVVYAEACRKMGEDRVKENALDFAVSGFVNDLVRQGCNLLLAKEFFEKMIGEIDKR